MTTPELLAAAELVDNHLDNRCCSIPKGKFEESCRLLARHVKAALDPELVTEAWLIQHGFRWGEDEDNEDEFLWVPCRNCGLRYTPMTVDTDSRLQVSSAFSLTTIRTGRPTCGEVLSLLAALGVEVGA